MTGYNVIMLLQWTAATCRRRWKAVLLNSNVPPTHPAKLHLRPPTPAHLYQHVSSVVETHDQGSHSRHVVHIGEGDEGDRGHVVREHDQKILGTQLSKEREKSITRPKQGALKV